MKKFKNKKKIVMILIVSLVIGAIVLILGINGYVKYIGKKNIITSEEAMALDDIDCILILGCGVRPDKTPSDMLSDRLSCGMDLYKKGVAPKIIMSGDHGQADYDEVNIMKQIAVDSSIPSNDVFMDHAGFSTYESIYRAKEIFEAERIVIVSQEYHLYRALYIAQKLGVEAYGVGADYHIYGGQIYRDIREVPARCKDFVKVLLKSEPTYLGKSIPVSGDGDVTNG